MLFLGNVEFLHQIIDSYNFLHHLRAPIISGGYLPTPLILPPPPVDFPRAMINTELALLQECQGYQELANGRELHSDKKGLEMDT